LSAPALQFPFIVRDPALGAASLAPMIEFWYNRPHTREGKFPKFNS
jgi:hypothetical protein